MKVIETQATPNPNAMKFVLDGRVSDGTVSFFSAEAARGHELAEKLFDVDGVSSLLLLGDFITVNKRTEVKWKPIVAAVTKVLKSVGA